MALPLSYTRLQVPVHADAYGGFGDMHGLLSFDGRQLKLAFQNQDAFFGVLKSEARELLLPLSAIERIATRAGWFWLSPSVELDFNDFALAARMPGSRGHSARLKVRFRDRKPLRRLVDAVQHAQAQDVHAALSAELHAEISAIAPEMPPPQPEPPARQVQPATPRRQTEDS